jgi:hypothetical protein
MTPQFICKACEQAIVYYEKPGNYRCFCGDVVLTYTVQGYIRTNCAADKVEVIWPTDDSEE